MLQCELTRRRMDTNPLFASAQPGDMSSASLAGGVPLGGYSPLFLRCFNILGILISWLIWIICQVFNIVNLLSALFSNKFVLSLLAATILAFFLWRSELAHSFLSPRLEELWRQWRSRPS